MKLFIETLRVKKPNVNVEHAEDIFELLKESYDAPCRFYHNWKHIQSCLYEFEMILSQIPEQYHFPVIIAIYYHDFYCNVNRVDNEKMSAKRAMYDLKALGYPEEDIQKIYNLICLTTHSKLCNDIGEKILLDIDLVILGQKYPQFSEYEKNIRREFQIIPDVSYSYQRIRFLKNLLKRGIIYQTEIFKEKFEEAARINVIASIKRSISLIQERQPIYDHLKNYLDDIC